MLVIISFSLKRRNFLVIITQEIDLCFLHWELGDAFLLSINFRKERSIFSFVIEYEESIPFLIFDKNYDNLTKRRIVFIEENVKTMKETVFWQRMHLTPLQKLTDTIKKRSKSMKLNTGESSWSNGMVGKDSGENQTCIPFPPKYKKTELKFYTWDLVLQQKQFGNWADFWSGIHMNAK